MKQRSDQPERCQGGFHPLDLLCCAPLVLLLLGRRWCAAHPEQVEHYREQVYPLLDLALGTIAHCLPCSPTELGLALLATLTGWWTLRGLRAWRPGCRRALIRRGLRRTVLLAGSIGLWFFAGWGVLYHRPPIERRWGLAPGEPAPERIQALAADAVRLANAAPPPPPAEPWPLQRDARRLARLVRRVAARRDAGSPPLLDVAARVPVAWRLLDALGIDGVTSPFFHEVLLNPQHGSPVRGAVLAHELAHAAGYAREDAASLVGLLACRSSSDPADRYAYALYLLLQLDGVRLADGRPARAHLAPRPAADLAAERARQRARRSPLTRAGRAVNDLYLRAAGDPHGTASYSRAVRLLAALR